MIRNITKLLFLLCVVSGFMWGGTNGRRFPDPVLMHPDTSAPDVWGYTWVRSTDPGGPTFNWVDIATRGTPAPILPTPGGLGDDNSVGPYPILFQFPYYWYTVTNFRIGSNGYIAFGNQAANFANPFTALPNTTAPNDMLAICAGDLDFTVAAANPQCFYWSNGVDSLVISFINVTEWQPPPANPNLKHTFQVVLSKTDSSITYQYGVQQGQYNSSANNLQLSIGMENQTGQIGLNYTFSTTTVGVPHPGMPTNGLAIKFKRTVNTGLAITDGGIVGGFDSGNLAKVVQMRIADTIKGIVKNFGTVPLSNVPVRYAITRAGQPSAFDTVIVPSLQPSEQVTVTFPRLFTPAVVGAYSALFNVTVPGDVGPGNNSRTAELVSASFAVGQSTRIQFENGTNSGNINWTGGGGMGVAFDVPLYPVRIESAFVQVTTAAQVIVEILDGSSGSPGAVLATRTINAAVGLNGVDFRSDSVRISGGRFFVGGRGTTGFAYEATSPISFRTWEYTNGWAPYRSADLQDIIIRATVKQEAPVVYAWSTQTSGTTQALRCMKTVSTAVGWIGGASGTVLRTTNGGTTWSSVGGGPMGTNTVFAIDALSATTAFVTTSPAAGTYIFRTTNGGTSWDTVFTQGTGGFLDAIKMFDANNGMAIGDPVGGTWTILRTTNGGTTWARIATEPVQVGTESGFNTSFTSIGTTHIWFGTNNSRVYRSTNGGATWSSGTTAFVSSTGVGFGDTQYGVAGGSGTTGAARTTDGGVTWTTVTLPSTGSIYGVAAKGGNFYAVRGTVVVRSTNQGATWDTAYPGAIGAFRHLDFLWNGANPYGWAVTATGGIARYGVVTTGVGDDDVTVLPQEFTLMQNYPNPFNPSTNIRYGLPRSAHVSVRIYNVLGQEVAQLKDGVESAGTHDAVWLGRNTAGQTVASGVYFYQLEARPVDGSSPFNTFRKMLLLK